MPVVAALTEDHVVISGVVVDQDTFSAGLADNRVRCSASLANRVLADEFPLADWVLLMADCADKSSVHYKTSLMILHGVPCFKEIIYNQNRAYLRKHKGIKAQGVSIYAGELSRCFDRQ